MKKKRFDVFISHASEDKGAFVEPLALELRKRGLSVWYDRFELNVGDSLREKIEEGLALCRYGVVVFSPSFLKKKWPKKELNGLFSREMGGRKARVLPILHELKFGALRKRYPIQADRYSLLSSAPIGEICDALIRVISPKLLELGALRERSFEASDYFLQKAKQKYPEYEFSVQVETSAGDLSGSGKPKRRVEIRKSDKATPSTMNVTFVGDGVAKANEFLRTGRPQTWTSREFENLKSDIPFFRAPGDGSIFSVGAAVDSNPRPVRVEVGQPSTVVFPLLTMRVARRGLEEGELEFRSDSEAFSFSITTSFTDVGKYSLSVSWKFSGSTAARCQRAIEAVDQLRRGTVFRIIDIREERPTIELPTNGLADADDCFDRGTRRLIALCCQIEREFNVALTLQNEVSEQDAENLYVLDCLLNDKDFGRRLASEFKLVKGSGDQLNAQLLALEGEGELRLFSPVSNYLGYFEIFGSKIYTESWGISSLGALVVSDLDRQKFRDAEEDFVVSCRLVGKGPAKVRWAKDGGFALSTSGTG
jgi:hypothetical protein